MVPLHDPQEVVRRNCVEAFAAVHTEADIGHERRFVAPLHEVGPFNVPRNLKKIAAVTIASEAAWCGVKVARLMPNGLIKPKW